MYQLYAVLCILQVLLKLSVQDIYLHNPRGSNNRLNEQTATRTNANRLFNSQNNDRGGYNVGDATSSPAQTEADQYQMRYFQSSLNANSFLKLEWTQQHGCGGNENTDPTKQNCYLVLQYLCDDVDNTDLSRLRDGVNTNTQGYTPMTVDTRADYVNRSQTDPNPNLGQHEPWSWYNKCRYRQRNSNLFTADQNLGNIELKYSSAIFTRQNPGGNRNGYECPEERDYYPYWHPTPWKDIAILTSNTSLCNQIYASSSFNAQPYYECVEFYSDNSQKTWSKYNNRNDCLVNNGSWTLFYNYLEKAPQFLSKNACESKSTANLTYKWALPYDSQNILANECLVLLNPPACVQADWTRSNHLGNTRDGQPSHYTWSLPYFPSNQAKKCVFRIRYNISTDDYDPFGTDSSSNNQKSPVRNDPYVNIGIGNSLQLAIDTSQYGRVFQDRSHAFYLLPRTNRIRANANIYNLNVRGKRGNIVQVYPAVEYDFMPNNLVLSTNDIVHVQWTGSNTHKNGGNGGDGQAGNDGNGNDGTDRTNLVQINTMNENFPLPYETCNIWSQLQIIGILTNGLVNSTVPYLLQTTMSPKDLALYFASSGYYQCVQSATCGTNSYQSLNGTLDADLNQAPASLPGVLLQFKASGNVYYYMCSRNNNFSNRSQKGTITVS